MVMVSSRWMWIKPALGEREGRADVLHESTGVQVALLLELRAARRRHRACLWDDGSTLNCCSTTCCSMSAWETTTPTPPCCRMLSSVASAGCALMCASAAAGLGLAAISLLTDLGSAAANAATRPRRRTAGPQSRWLTLRGKREVQGSTAWRPRTCPSAATAPPRTESCPCRRQPWRRAREPGVPGEVKADRAASCSPARRGTSAAPECPCS